MFHTRKNVHTVQEDTEDSDDLSENCVQRQNICDVEYAVCTVKEDKWTAPLLVNGKLVAFKIDTGALLRNQKELRTRPCC